MGQKFLNHIDHAPLSQEGYSPGLLTRPNIISHSKISMRKLVFCQNSATLESIAVFGDFARDPVKYIHYVFAMNGNHDQMNNF